MNIEDVLFSTVDWTEIESTEHPGASGTSFWKTWEKGNLRVRMVEYSAGFCTDHWCERGHVLLVLEGELEIELKDGRRFLLKPGTGFQVADGIDAHRAYTQKGAKVFIVD